MRIASLLPSATEICCLLDLGDSIVGVSHECDFPSGIQGRPVLTEAKINSHLSSIEIDRQVRELVNNGLSVYRVHEDLLRELKPDLIVTQDTCEVCAVSFKEVEAAVAKVVGQKTSIVSLSPMTLTDVLQDIIRVGRASGRETLARKKVSELEARLQNLKTITANLPKPKVLALEWIDPPMIAGHWTPELIRIAGGDPILGHDGKPTGPVAWVQVLAAAPDVILVMPCGFKIEQSTKEMEFILSQPGFKTLPAFMHNRIYVLDGNAYFNRPGPRLVESAELAAVAIHPQLAEHFNYSASDLIRWRIG